LRREIRSALNVEPLPSRIEEPSYVGSAMCPEWAGQVLLGTPTGKWSRGRPRTWWCDFISDLAWSRVGVEPAELSEIAVDRAVCRDLLGLLPRDPLSGKNGYENKWTATTEASRNAVAKKLMPRKLLIYGPKTQMKWGLVKPYFACFLCHVVGWPQSTLKPTNCSLIYVTSLSKQNFCFFCRTKIETQGQEIYLYKKYSTKISLNEHHQQFGIKLHKNKSTNYLNYMQADNGMK